MSFRRAFTLVEMLLVVAIFSLLIAILLPTVAKARGHAAEVRCKAHIRQVGDAFQAFALNHMQVLPAASHGGWEGTEPWQKCWVGKEGSVPGFFAPANEGPLVKYLGGGGNATKAFYRCEALKVAPPKSGLGSNGGFDFTMFLSFGGARLPMVPRQARVIYMSDPFGPAQSNLRTPLIIEENPAFHCNSISIEPGFGSIDRSANHHVSGGSIYVTVDGGVDTLTVTASMPPQAHDWFVTSRRGNNIRLNVGMTYGDWKAK